MICPLSTGILIFVLGAIFGSFFNVCIYRIPKKRSLISPRSFCPKCQKTISFYDNIPIISYIILKGKCRFCNKSIGLRYPIVELLSSIVFLLCFLKFGMHLSLVAYLILFSICIIISFIDLDTGTIPDVLTIPGIILGISLSLFTKYIPFIKSLIGFVVGAGVLLLVTILWKLLFKKKAMGGGDIKLLGMMGAFVGPVYVLFILFTGSLLGVIFGLVTRNRKLRFGPFLSMSLFLVLFFGDKLLKLFS